MSDFETAWRKAVTQQHKDVSRIAMFGPTPEEEARWAEEKRIRDMVDKIRPRCISNEDSWRAGYELYNKIYNQTTNK